MNKSGLIFGAATMMGLLFSTANAAQPGKATNVQLRTDVSVPYCTFDRSRATSKRMDALTAVGDFSIQCRPGSKAFRLTTELSPFANITLEDNTKYNVKWFVNQGKPACEDGFVVPGAISLHSGNRAIDLTDSKSKRDWQYCVKLEPKLDSTITTETPWPLQGELSIILVDAEKGFLLPSDASRIHVRFNNNSSHMSEGMQRVLDNLLMNLGDPTQYHVQLHAHASMLGDAEYNHDLSIMRLKRIREYLMEKYNVNLLDTWGQAWGESRPMALNTIEDEATQNRRVDVIFIPKKESRIAAN